MPTDPTPLPDWRQRIERARAVAASQPLQEAPAPAPVAAPVPPAAPAVPRAAAFAPAVPDTDATGTPKGSMNAQQRLTWDIVRAAQLAGARDLTRREVWLRLCAQAGKPQPDGANAGRINELLRMGWLHERPEKRASVDSQALSRPVYVPSHLVNAAPAQGGRQ